MEPSPRWCATPQQLEAAHHSVNRLAVDRRHPTTEQVCIRLRRAHDIKPVGKFCDAYGKLFREGAGFILKSRMAIVRERIYAHQCDLEMRRIENGSEGLERIQSSIRLCAGGWGERAIQLYE